MRLYKVSGDKIWDKILYITAIDKSMAILKYYSELKISEYSNVTALFICERDDIIPTIEPIKE
jgi:hypothetical protein